MRVPRASSSPCSTRPAALSARTPLWRGKVDGITGPNPVVSENGGNDQPLTLDEKQPYHDALGHIRERVLNSAGRPLDQGHRPPHRAWRNKILKPMLIDAQVLADLKSYIPLAPLHQPFALEAIETLLQTRPDLPQVVCFDTAFHRPCRYVEKSCRCPGPPGKTACVVTGFTDFPIATNPLPWQSVMAIRLVAGRWSRTWAAAPACAACGI